MRAPERGRQQPEMRDSEREAARDELFGAEATRISDHLTEAYLSLARVEPDAISAVELRALRRSRHPGLRSSVPVVLSQRRPRFYLQVATRFLADPAPEVRETAVDGVGGAALMLGLNHLSPEIRPLLEMASRDRSKRVKQAAREIALVLADTV